MGKNITETNQETIFNQQATLAVSQQLIELQGKMRSAAFSFCRDWDSVNDLVQDTNVKVIENAGSYQPGTNFWAWVRKIMRNIYINQYNQKRNRNEYLHYADADELAGYENVVSCPADNADLRISVNEIENIIARQKDPQRIPFEMYKSGLKYKEIAEKLGLSMGTVKSRIFFLRKKIMEELGEPVSASFNRTA